MQFYVEVPVMRVRDCDLASLTLLPVVLSPRISLKLQNAETHRRETRYFV
jgi:hypothetical protein